MSKPAQKKIPLTAAAWKRLQELQRQKQDYAREAQQRLNEMQRSIHLYIEALALGMGLDIDVGQTKVVEGYLVIPAAPDEPEADEADPADVEPVEDRTNGKAT